MFHTTAPQVLEENSHISLQSSHFQPSNCILHIFPSRVPTMWLREWSMFRGEKAESNAFFYLWNSNVLGVAWSTQNRQECWYVHYSLTETTPYPRSWDYKIQVDDTTLQITAQNITENQLCLQKRNKSADQVHF